tara:strand:- start:4096 stop:5802 length:1707 start_codon:yes stop_codon:yes gene_type:complete
MLNLTANSKILSIYGSHDSSATFKNKEGNLTTLEYERFAKKRYAMYSKCFNYTEADGIFVNGKLKIYKHPLGTSDVIRDEFIRYIKENIYDEDVELILYNELALEKAQGVENGSLDKPLLSKYFPNANLIEVGHHTAHICGAFFTSPFKDATIISIDGGGRERDQPVTTMWATAKDNKITNSEILPYDFGNAYGYIGFPISEIKPGPDSESNSLVYAGKVMGLCAYGKVREEWIKPMYEFYNSTYNRNLGQSLFNKPFTLNCLKGQDSYDLAATSQHVFEQKFFELFWDKIVENNTDVILVGGCALNVLLNQKLAERLETINKKLYIPPDPNDCGLSLGQFLSILPGKIKHNVYSGFPILDEDKFNAYKNDYNATECSIKKLVDVIKDGKIVGIIQGGSEVGPRALGNRSIICDPSIKDMKDILNSKVKFREWYRPFAPVCRYEDRSKYFDNAFESKYMSYAPTVKPEYRKVLPSITHVDGTARLQTVRREDHKLFYDILSELRNRDEIPVILNTSFNIKGAPILTTIEDALYVLDNTEMDYVYCNGFLFDQLEADVIIDFFDEEIVY